MFRYSLGHIYHVVTGFPYMRECTGTYKHCQLAVLSRPGTNHVRPVSADCDEWESASVIA